VSVVAGGGCSGVVAGVELARKAGTELERPHLGAKIVVVVVGGVAVESDGVVAGSFVGDGVGSRCCVAVVVAAREVEKGLRSR